jgi:hypothetical protein
MMQDNGTLKMGIQRYLEKPNSVKAAWLTIALARLREKGLSAEDINQVLTSKGIDPEQLKKNISHI